MKDHVSCYAGAANPEHPRAVTCQGQRFTVDKILQRRRTPAGVGFLVQCSPDWVFFDLFYLTCEDRWQIQPR
jgi:hypothetical protein